MDNVSGGILVDSPFLFARVWNVMVLGFSNTTAHECSGAYGAVPGGVFPGNLKILFGHTVWYMLSHWLDTEMTF
jgi:hypothetical protein